MLKTCTRCNEEKPLEAFHNQKRGKFGKQAHCKSCDTKRANDWYKRTRQPGYVKSGIQAKPLDRIDKRINAIILHTKNRAARSGIKFDLHEHREDVAARMRARVCEVSGIELEFHPGARLWNTPSIDRIKPEDGYIYSNIRIVAYAVNLGFGTWGMEKYLELARAIDARYKLQQEWEHGT